MTDTDSFIDWSGGLTAEAVPLLRTVCLPAFLEHAQPDVLDDDRERFVNLCVESEDKMKPAVQLAHLLRDSKLSEALASIECPAYLELFYRQRRGQADLSAAKEQLRQFVSRTGFQSDPVGVYEDIIAYQEARQAA